MNVKAVRPDGPTKYAVTVLTFIDGNSWCIWWDGKHEVSMVGTLTIYRPGGHVMFPWEQIKRIEHWGVVE